MPGKKKKGWDALVREGMGKLLPQATADEKMKGRLESLGLKTTYANAIALSLMDKAAGGDLSAAKFVREILSEDPDRAQQTQNRARRVEEMDLSALSDEQLEELADLAEEQP